MRKLWIRTALAAFSTAVAGLAVPTPEIVRQPAPEWVQPLPLPESNGDSPDGVRVLLIDEQVHAGLKTAYGHYARTFTNVQGVQDGSRISITFDPSNRKLALHALKIHRDGRILDRLETEPVRILAREQSMESDLYDGSITVVIDVEDVRAGDILEYALSIEGENPVFGGRYSNFVSTTWARPPTVQQFRLLWPEGRHLAWEVCPEMGKLEYRQSSQEGMTEHVWGQKGIAPTPIEGDTPAWYSPYGWLQISEYKNWGEVVRWAREFYVLPEDLPEEVDAEIARILDLPTGNERILGALTYVQKRLRYLSVSDGVHSHAPYPVDEVLRRGYGDCKDKARMLVAMLQKLGFDASPALVNTQFRKAVADWLPTPDAFDHVIVTVRWRGRNYWIDPTAHHQAGPLGERYIPDCGFALVLREGEDALTAVPPWGHRQMSVETTETYDIPDYASDVGLNVVSTYRGLEADWIRGRLDGADRDEIHRSYLNFIARQHPGARSDGSPQFSDDKDANTMDVRERYKISPFFRASNEEPHRLRADFYPYQIDAVLRDPSTALRLTPLAVAHPKTITERFVMHLPRGGVFKNEHKEIADGAFRFGKTVNFSNDTLTVTHRYESLADHVPPERIAEYLRNIRSAREVLGYSISIPKSFADPGGADGMPDFGAFLARVNWPLLCVFVFVGIFCGMLAIAVWFWRPAWPPPVNPPGPSGIHGWLVLLGIGVAIAPLRLIVGIFPFAVFLDIDQWRELTTPGNAFYHPFLSLVLIVESAVNIALFFAGCLAAVLFFRKRRTFPVIQISILGFGLAFGLIDYFVCMSMGAAFRDTANDGAKTIIQGCIAAAIWIPYLLVSERVRSTFVR